MKCYILIVVMFSISQSVKSTFCFWNTGCPYKYFSSRTPYGFVRGDIRDSVIKIKGCKPISIWAFYRHGKRNPGDYFGKNIKMTLSLRDYIESSYKNGKSSLCAQDIDNLHNWSLDPKFFHDLDLADEGYDDMYGIANRLKQTYPEILTNLNDGDYTLKPAHGSRMVLSVKAFVDGLDSGKLFIHNDTHQADVMHPYVTCGKFHEAKDDPTTYIEVAKYAQTAEYLAAKDRIQRRLGIDYILTDKNITGLYDLCRYTSGKDGKFSPWCALFTKEDLMVLEYIGDIKLYYRNSYGSPFSKKFGQIPMADLLKKFRLAKDGKGEKLTAYCTHGTMVDMVYVALGLFKDKRQLTAAHRDPERKWRSSKLTSFSANIAAVLNECTTDDVIDHNVVFYHNEEPLLTMCKNGVCSWQEFEEKLEPFLNTNIDFCEYEKLLHDGEPPVFNFPYATCGKFYKDIKDNPETYIEILKYTQTAEYQTAKDRIQRRLGIDYILTDKNITGLYDLCRYTSGKEGKFSPWCALFTKEDLIVLEYIGDMKQYYKNSYGSPLSGKFGQIPMADLLTKFRLAKDGKGEKLIAYFTHGTMVNMVYVALGLFKDKIPLTAAHRDPERGWKTSKMTSFSANIVAVLNKCIKEGVIDHNVVFYLNEEPLLSICKHGVCSWREFEEKLEPFLKTENDFCEFELSYDDAKTPVFDFK